MNMNMNVNNANMNQREKKRQLNDYQEINDNPKRNQVMESNQSGVQNNNINISTGNEIDQLTQQVKNINANKKIVKKEVEIMTKITYTYEDGSTKEINEVKKHNFVY